MSGEISNDWLARCSRTASTSDQRRLAALTLAEYNLFVQVCKARGVATRRSFWDMMSGMRQVGPNGYEFFDDFTPMRSGPVVFLTPVFAEGCRRYGRTPPKSVVSMGVLPESHRSPQTTKWKNLQLETPPPKIVFAGSVFVQSYPGVYAVQKVGFSFTSSLGPAAFSAFTTTVAGQIAVLEALRKSRSEGRVSPSRSAVQ